MSTTYATEPIIEEPVVWRCITHEPDPLDCSNEFKIVPVETLIGVSETNDSGNSNFTVVGNDDVEQINFEVKHSVTKLPQQVSNEASQVTACSIMLDRNEVMQYYCLDTNRYKLSTKCRTRQARKVRTVPYNCTRKTTRASTSQSSGLSSIDFKPQSPTQDLSPPDSPISLPSIHQGDIDSESDSEKYICKYCDTKCPTSYNLQLHLKDKHSIIEKSRQVKTEARNAKTLKRDLPISDDTNSESDNEKYNKTSCVFRDKCKKYICKYCDKKYPTLYKLQVHLKYNHSVTENNKQLKINSRNSNFTCKMDFNSQSTLLRHEKNEHKASHKNLQTSNHSSEKNQSLKNKLNSNSNSTFSCKSCTKIFKYKTNLVEHEKCHSNNITGKYQCGICSVRYDIIKDLENHMQIHDNDSKNDEKEHSGNTDENFIDTGYYCQICTRKLPTLSLLKRHKTIIHFNFNCKIINNLLINCNPSNIIYENLNPSKIQFLCHLCSYVCVKTKYIRAHLCSKHNKTYDYHCNKCTSIFKTKNEYSEHIKKHENLNIEFKCKFCTFKSTTRYNLNIHLINHLIIEPFNCQLCNNKYKRKYNLREHYSYKHSIKKNQSTCEFCNNSFMDINDLNNHFIKDHMKSSYFCKFCKIYFEDKQSLIAHKKIPHFEEYVSFDDSCESNGEDSDGQNDTNEMITVADYCEMSMNVSDTECSYKASIKPENDITEHHSNVVSSECGINSNTSISLYKNPNIINIVNRSKKRVKVPLEVSKYYNHVIIKLKSGFKCRFCTFRTKSKCILIKHLINHLIIKPYICQFCNVRIKRRDGLREHYKRSHKKLYKPLTCDLCDNRDFIDKFDLQNHILRDHFKSMYRCIYCRIHFVDENELEAHKMIPHFEIENNWVDDKINSSSKIIDSPCLDSNGFEPEQTEKSSNKNDVHNDKLISDSCMNSDSNIESKLEKTVSGPEENASVSNHKGLETICNKTENCIEKNQSSSKINKNSNNGFIKLKSGLKCRFCSFKTTAPNLIFKHLLIHLIIKPHICQVCNTRVKCKAILKEHYIRSHKSFKPLTCKICSENTFIDNCDLQNHILKGHIKVPHCCKVCKIYFPDEISMKEHDKIPHFFTTSKYIKSNLNEVSIIKNCYTCKICSFKTNKKDIFRKHLLIHSIIRPYKCQHCPSNYKRRYNLKEHYMNSHSLIYKPLICNKCNKEYIDKNDMKNHYIRDHFKSQYHCYLCRLHFISKNDLEKHEKIPHFMENPFKDDSIEKSVEIEEKNDSKKVAHFVDDNIEKIAHSKIRPYKCQYCSSNYKNRYDLKKHISNSHSLIYKPLICDKCNKKCIDKFDMENHYIRDHINSHYYCYLCSIYFISKSDLKKHEKIPHFEKTFNDDIENNTEIESNEKNTHECMICTKRYSSNDNLKLHMLNKHNYQDSCPYCIKIYKKLGSHINNIHLDLNEYTCKYCNDKFIGTVNLKQHVHALHSEELLIECKYCNERFSKRIDVKNHIKIQHNKKTFLCQYCGYYTFSNASLIAHLKYVHENNNRSTKKVKCPKCSKMILKIGINMHIEKYHNKNNKKLTCNICKNKYVNLDSLRCHKYNMHNVGFGFRRQRNIIGDHKCTVCFLRFKFQHTMLNHYNREHVPCVCDICNSRIKGKHSMEKHLEYSHGMKEKVYPCKKCKHVALTPGRLQKHLVAKHKN